MTRFRAVVRADSVRQLTDEGWEDLVSYGVRTIVDLRVEREIAADPPHDPRVEVVNVPVTRPEDEPAIDRAWRSSPDVLGAYLAMTDLLAPNLARAIEAVADADDDGAVLVHCFAGKDRTGLVCGLILRLAGVAVSDIAADYGLSAGNLGPVFESWVAEAPDEEERAFRLRIGSSPPEAMARLLERLEGRFGTVEAYLLEAGASEAALRRVRARLLGSPS